jgi:hypothetical protein
MTVAIVTGPAAGLYSTSDATSGADGLAPCRGDMGRAKYLGEDTGVAGTPYSAAQRALFQAIQMAVPCNDGLAHALVRFQGHQGSAHTAVQRRNELASALKELNQLVHAAEISDSAPTTQTGAMARQIAVVNSAALALNAAVIGLKTATDDLGKALAAR